MLKESPAVAVSGVFYHGFDNDGDSVGVISRDGRVLAMGQRVDGVNVLGVLLSG